jgi:tripartite-type tricarboxylate transporter receptor subunit TctC
MRILGTMSAAALILAACGGDTGGGDTTASVAEAPAADTADERPFYEGKRVSLIVPFATGGGTDLIARYLARVLSETLPGNPAVQVINAPGAGTVIGHNDFASRPADGLSWFLGGGSGNINYIFRNADNKYDYRDWDAYMGVAQGAVVYASPTTGLTSAADLLNPAQPLIWASQGAGGADLARLFTAEVLGVEFTPVFGYAGSGGTRIAFEQGESNLNVETTTSYRANVVPLIEAGQVVPLYSQGQLTADGTIGRDPSVPDLPHVLEVYEVLYGRPMSGIEYDAHVLLTSATAIYNKILWMHKDAPQAARDALRAGIAALPSHPSYADAVKDVFGGYQIDVGEAFERTLDEIITNVDPALVDWIIDYANRRYDAGLGG